MKNAEIALLALGVVAAAGVGYYFLVYQPAHPLPAPPAPQPPQPVPNWPMSFYTPAGVSLPPGLVSGAPPNPPKLVTLTTTFQAYDLSNGMIQVFKPGDKVWAYPNPDGSPWTVGGWTVVSTTNTSDPAQSPHIYATQSAVAGMVGIAIPTFRGGRRAIGTGQVPPNMSRQIGTGQRGSLPPSHPMNRARLANTNWVNW